MGFLIVEILGEDGIDEQYIKEKICSEDSSYDESEIIIKEVDDDEVNAYIEEFMRPKE